MEINIWFTHGQGAPNPGQKIRDWSDYTMNGLFKEAFTNKTKEVSQNVIKGDWYGYIKFKEKMKAVFVEMLDNKIEELYK